MGVRACVTVGEVQIAAAGQQGTAHGVAIAVSSRVCALISGLAWPGMPHPILSKARQ